MSGCATSDTHQREQGLEQLRTDPVNGVELLHGLEPPVLPAPVHYPLRQHRPDARESPEFLEAGGVEVDLPATADSVSYTHLTLPTILIV